MVDWRTMEGRGHFGGEREWFRDVARHIAYSFDRFSGRITIVNIGVYKGCSAHCFRAGAPGANLYGIDVREYGLIAPDELDMIFIKADSTKCHALFDKPIHLLFVDGSHRPEDVLKDIGGWGPKVVVGGIMALHDYERTPEEHARRPVGCGTRQLIGVSQAVNAWWALPWVQEEWVEIRAVGSIRAFERVAGGTT